MVAAHSKMGAVLYARDLGRVARFYASVLGLQPGETDEEYVILEAPGFQLVVLRIPERIAASIVIATPPRRRDNVAIKPVFFVSSIAATRGAVEAGGGVMNPPTKEWSFQGVTVCDALDPEGNVFQVEASRG